MAKWLLLLVLVSCSKPCPPPPPPPVCPPLPTTKVEWIDDFDFAQSDIVKCLYNAKEHDMICMGIDEFNIRLNITDSHGNPSNLDGVPIPSEMLPK